MDTLTSLDNILKILINPITWLFSLGILILLFLALREAAAWYWKINKMVSLLEEIKNNTVSKEGNEQTALPIDVAKSTTLPNLLK